ncbi:MAG: hypothetical protein KKF74_01000 [Nanoarchaeota archaeon]|nr:hypothetical protein [Nanoarchaeota archaeon]
MKKILFLVMLVCVFDSLLVSAADENNSCNGLRIEVSLDDALFLGKTYTGLFRIDNLDHVSGITDYINLTVVYNISGPDFFKQDVFELANLNSYKTAGTGDFKPDKEGNYTICGQIINSTVDDINKEDDISCRNISVINTLNIPCNISLNIGTWKNLYFDEPTVFYLNLNNETFTFIIEYWVEDLFGNVVKNPINTTNTNKKSFSPKLDEPDRAFIIKASLAFIACNDSNKDDNYAERLFVVKGEEPAKESKIEISELYLNKDNAIEFGEALKAKISIYKGDSTKNVVSVWAENQKANKISTETSKITITKKFSENIITVPIQLKLNCDSKLDEGRHFLVVEGLGIKTKKEFLVKGNLNSLCPKETKPSTETASETKSNSKFSYKIISFPLTVENNNEFKTQILITAKDETRLNIWSYVYRGSKCYSGEREDNIQQVLIQSNENKTIELENTIIDAEPGDYKLKVKLLLEGQKTEKEITENIEVIESIEAKDEKNEKDISKLELNETIEKTTAEYSCDPLNLIGNEIPLGTVYMSTSEKASNLAKYIFLGLSVLLNVLLIWRR